MRIRPCIALTFITLFVLASCGSNSRQTSAPSAPPRQLTPAPSQGRASDVGDQTTYSYQSPQGSVSLERREYVGGRTTIQSSATAAPAAGLTCSNIKRLFRPTMTLDQFDSAIVTAGLDETNKIAVGVSCDFTFTNSSTGSVGTSNVRINYKAIKSGQSCKLTDISIQGC